MPPPYPLFPGPRLWSFKDTVLVPYLRGDVTNTVQFLTQRPVFIGAQQAAAQSIANGTPPTLLTLDTELADGWAMHSTTAATANIYFPLAYWWLIESGVPINNAVTTSNTGAGVAFTAAGGSATHYLGGIIGTDSFGSIATAAKLIQVTNPQVGYAFLPGNNAVDFASITGYQNSGVAKNTLISASKFPYGKLRWIGTGNASSLVLPPLTAVPTPITSAWLNANVKDTVRFFINPPFLEYSNNATQSIASQNTFPATGTAVTVLGTKTVDNYSAFAPGTGIFTAPVAGRYYLYFQAAFQDANVTTGQARSAGLTVTSTNYNSGTAITFWGNSELPNVAASTNVGHCSVVRKRLRLNANDTISPAAFQRDSGATARTLGAIGTCASRFIAIWEAAA